MTDWSKIAQQAGQNTSKQMEERMASLTKLSGKELTDIMQESGITEAELQALIQTLQMASDENERKAELIRKTNRGLEFLIAFAVRKLI
ncbi:MAG: hypothetical protein ACXITV_00040 [Luteibaculaceae bacterium]